LRQPMAQDLRFITAAMKINSELERIGDQAVNIAQNAQELIKLADQDLLIDIDNMAGIMIKMVRESLDALVKRDAELAEQILLKDNDVDNLKRKVFTELLNNLKLDIKPEINRSIELLLISRNIEKIADHATNICEDVIFMALGKDIRHHNIN
ncbi:phosphate signaling complex protein PhoU, partial [Candidatus Poribacteria bacterium]|nr:phosphate signaling complex protein PhoU [Candidatus Poribacteria bacterium]